MSDINIHRVQSVEIVKTNWNKDHGVYISIDLKIKTEEGMESVTLFSKDMDLDIVVVEPGITAETEHMEEARMGII